jgi:hypothetical protein
MGCDIHTIIEVKENDVWKVLKIEFPKRWEEGTTDQIWDSRMYSRFAVLAGVRNYAGIKPFSGPRGIPTDISVEAKEFLDCDYHTHSWYSLKELLEFDWNTPCENRRVGRQISENLFSGAETCESGQGIQTTYGALVGDDFLEDLQILKAKVGEQECRILFAFDN